ncbi:MAG: dTDP-4-dehydrorhamnose reductase [Pseudomonadales bacterium]
MNIVVIGKSGQLAHEIMRLAGDDSVHCLGRDDINILDAVSIASVLNRFQPAGIINASAYTAVDKAESDQANAFALNQTAVANLATYARQHHCHLVHVSTDYVFGGDKGSPYQVDDSYHPQGVYGASKAAGEKALLDIYPQASCILRTSWVYASHGNNFVKTMLRLMAEKPELGVIDDQIGTPTWARDLAKACIYAIKNRVSGVHHWTDNGVASWYDFAVAIQSLALEKGLLTHAIPIKPIPSSAYPTPAKRPHYSVLDKSTLVSEFSELVPQYWRKALGDMLDELI